MKNESINTDDEDNQSKIIKQGKSEYKTIEEEDIEKELGFLEGVSIIDQIFENQGYNANTLKCIFIGFLVLCVEGLHMALFSSMIIPLKNFYNLTQGYIGLISSVIFVGVGLGSFISGWASNKYGRTFLINAFLLLIYFSTLISSISDSCILFAVFRFVIGLGLGLVVPISLNLLTEYLPIKYRSLVLTSIWIGFGVGNMYLLALIYFIMPNYEAKEVKTIFLWSSFLPLFTFVYSFKYLEDSPRNLIMHNKNEEAFEILEKSLSKKISKNIKHRIIREVKHGNMDHNHNSTLKEIFLGKFTILTLLLSIVWCADSLICYGTGLISSLTLKLLGVVEKYDNKQIILKQMAINIISSLGNILGGVLSEIPFLGRNRTTIINFFLSAVFLSLIPFYSSNYTVLFSLAQFFWCIAMNVNTTYSCEVYPTHIRDQAVGFLFFTTRVGGFLSQFLFIYLNDLGLWVPYYIATLLLFFNAFMTYLMPYETIGKPLDTNNYENSYDTKHHEVEVKT